MDDCPIPNAAALVGCLCAVIVFMMGSMVHLAILKQRGERLIARQQKSLDKLEGALRTARAVNLMASEPMTNTTGHSTPPTPRRMPSAVIKPSRVSGSGSSSPSGSRPPSSRAVVKANKGKGKVTDKFDIDSDEDLYSA